MTSNYSSYTSTVASSVPSVSTGSLASSNLFTLEQMHTVEFDSTHLWSVILEGAPEPFNQWCPAVNFDEDIFNITSKSFDIGNEQFEMPDGFMARGCRLEMYDAVDERLLQWIIKWVTEEMYYTNGKYQGMNYLEEYCKTLQVRKYDYQHNLISHKNYIVTPMGSMKLTRTNEPNPQLIPLDLRIQGETKIV